MTLLAFFAAERRAAERRVAERRVAERCVAERRAAKRRVAEHRVAERRVAERRVAKRRVAAAPLLLGARRCRSISPACRANSSQPAAAAAQNGTDRQINGRTDGHCIVTKTLPHITVNKT